MIKSTANSPKVKLTKSQEQNLRAHLDTGRYAIAHTVARRSLLRRGLVRYFDEEHTYMTEITDAGRQALGTAALALVAAPTDAPLPPTAEAKRDVLIPARLLEIGNRIGKYVAGKFVERGKIDAIEWTSDGLRIQLDNGADDLFLVYSPDVEVWVVDPDTVHPSQRAAEVDPTPAGPTASAPLTEDERELVEATRANVLASQQFGALASTFRLDHMAHLLAIIDRLSGKAAE